jgi:hypothetical protein
MGALVFVVHVSVSQFFVANWSILRATEVSFRENHQIGSQ